MEATATENISVIRENENSGKQIELDYVAVKNAVIILRAINNKLRQKIIKLLKENERLNVTSIYVKLHIEQSVASQHLASSRRANIVIAERDGRVIYYSLNYARIAEIIRISTELDNILFH